MEDAGDWFSDRQPPSAAMAVLFRQSAGEYSRLHPRSLVRPNWRQRFGVARTALKLVRGQGPLPNLIEGFPTATFADLERPLGALDPKILVPLDGYFESLVASWRYATLGYWRLVVDRRHPSNGAFLRGGIVALALGVRDQRGFGRKKSFRSLAAWIAEWATVRC